MKKTALFLLLLTFLKATAHEDSHIAVERSNVHIRVQVGYEWSWELRIIESYAEIINDFIREIDSTEKVFIQFEEDYCYFYDNLFFLAYGDFKDFVPSGFPWLWQYDMEFINTHRGINVKISERHFSLKTLLQLLEFGLLNKNHVIEKGKIFKGKNEYKHEYVIDFILQNDLSALVKKYLSKKVEIQNIPEVLVRRNIKLFLQNDSILFVDNEGFEFLRLSTIDAIRVDRTTSSIFILNTNRSFYFINQNLKSNQKQYELPFELCCLDALWVKYLPEKSKFRLEKDGMLRLSGIDTVEDWVYFDEINGITKR